MAGKLIFLSHIHGESIPALAIKLALEAEFAGFVDVFVSSDETSIPTGRNFIQRIENALSECVAAMYLISPVSVQRSWMNFELGAVWLRDFQDRQKGGPGVPTLPLCHSGSVPNKLPMPLEVLQAVSATNAEGLRRAFAEIQRVVGGKGSLRTDFVQLADKVATFEKEYTFASKARRLLEILSLNKDVALAWFDEHQGFHGDFIVDSPLDEEFQQLLLALVGHVRSEAIGIAMGMGTDSQGRPKGVNGPQYRIALSREVITSA